MLQSIAAVVAGYAIMVVMVMGGTMAIMAAFVPGGLAAMRGLRAGGGAAMPKPTPRYYAMNITLSLLAAFVAGWLTALIAGATADGARIGLAIVVILMAIASGFMDRGQQPVWYKLLLPVIGVAGIALSATLIR